MKGEKMVTVSRHFKCRDCSNLVHEFDYPFEANDHNTLIKIIKKFIEDLEKAGWRVIETLLNEEDLNNGPDIR